MMITFMLTVFAWIFFRAASVADAFTFISGMFSTSLFTLPTVNPYKVLPFLGLFIFIEWLGREQQYAIANLGIQWNKTVRWGMYYFLVFIILYFTGNEQQFIYFQF